MATTTAAGPEAPPPDLRGAPRADRFMRGLTAFSDSYLQLMSSLRAMRGPREPRPPGPALPGWRKLVVSGRADECAEVVSLRLAAPSGGPLPRWQPGAHLQLELPSGRVRHYSLCGDPRDRGAYRIAVRRIEGGGGGSAEIHGELRPGTVLRVCGPRNAFPFAAESPVLLIAGGIGITPILPMARLAAGLGLDWRLVYAGRSRATMPFLAEVAAVGGMGGGGGTAGGGAAACTAAGGTAADTAGGGTVGGTAGGGTVGGTAGRVAILADDEAGVPDCADVLRQAPAGAAVYACGPPPMLAGVRAAAEAAATAGLIRAFHFERFTAAPVTDGHPFEVEAARSGTVLPVPAERSVLDVLRAWNPGTPYSCQQGFCGTCRQRVLRGGVDHRDQRLTDAERAAGDMLVCVSRAPEGERLVLDL